MTRPSLWSDMDSEDPEPPEPPAPAWDACEDCTTPFTCEEGNVDRCP